MELLIFFLEVQWRGQVTLIVMTKMTKTIKAYHYYAEVFAATGAEAALAAGIFHRHEVEISAVKQHLRQAGIETRT